MGVARVSAAGLGCLSASGVLQLVDIVGVVLLDVRAEVRVETALTTVQVLSGDNQEGRPPPRSSTPPTTRTNTCRTYREHGLVDQSADRQLLDVKRGCLVRSRWLS